jgi:cell division protein FtsZ
MGLLDIKIIGCGGGGVNAVNNMYDFGITGVEFVALNTDAQALITSPAQIKLDIGREVTKGLGAGSDPELGRLAAEENFEDIKDIVFGTDLVFVTAGMGGGTGTGSAPVVAKAAKEAGCLVIGVVTTPFGFEGKQRMSKALDGIEKLKKEVDAIIVIPNDNLLKMLDTKITMQEAFQEVDMVLLKGVASITDLITTPGVINVDFADVRKIMTGAGTTFMGVGAADGEERAQEAAELATTSPILDGDFGGAKGVLISIASSSSIGMGEVNHIATAVSDKAHEDANIIFGTVLDEELGDEIRVTVIATGFETRNEND